MLRNRWIVAACAALALAGCKNASTGGGNATTTSAADPRIRGVFSFYACRREASGAALARVWSAPWFVRR